MSSGSAIANAYIQLIPSAEGMTDGITAALGGAQAAGNNAASGIGASFMAAGKQAAAALSGLPFAELVKDSLGLGAAFGSSMSNVYALMSSANDGLGLTNDQMAALEARAREMGATSVFSAQQAADAMGYMALAGWDADQVITGLPDMLNLAAAAGMDLATASDIVTDGLTAFGMGAEDAAEFVDTLATVSANSNTTVEDLGEAFRNVGALAGAMGYSVQDTSWALGIMANAGIKGAQAGTALKSALNNMGTNSEAQKEMERLGVSMFDANGKARPLIDVMTDLRGSFAGMSAEEQQASAKLLAGSYGMAGFLTIMNATGDSCEELDEKLQNAGGSAKTMADIMSDNLAGDTKAATSAFDEIKLTVADLFGPIARKAVQGLTGLLQKFNSLNPVIKKGAIGFAGIMSAMGPLKVILPVLKTALAGPVGPLLLIGSALAVVATRSRLFKTIVDKVKTAVGAFMDTLDAGGSVPEAFKNAVVAAFGDEAWTTISGVITTVSTAVTTLWDAFTNLTTGLSNFLLALMDGEGIGAAWEAMKSTFSEFDWAGLGKTAWGLIKTGIVGLKTWFSQKWGEAKTALSEIDWRQVGLDCFEAVKNGMSAAATAIGTWISSLFDGFSPGEAITSIGKTIWTTITNAIKTTMGNVGSFISGLFSGFTAGENESGIGSSIGSAIKGGVETVLDVGGSWLSAGFTAAKTAIESINWGNVGSTIIGGFNTVAGAFDKAGTFLSAGFTAAKDTISKINWETIGGGIKDAFTGAVETIGKIGSSIWDTITGWFSGGEKDEANSEAQQAAKGVTDAFSGSLTAENGQTIGKAFASGISTGIGTVDLSACALEFYTKVETAMNDQIWTNIGAATIGDSIISGMNSKAGGVGSAASNIANKAKGAFNANAWNSVGGDMINGLIKGMNAKKGSVQSALKTIIDEAIAAAKKSLGIASPSKVMAKEVGQWIPAGIGMGISTSADKAIDPLLALGEALSGGMDGSTMSLSRGVPAAAAAGGYSQTVNVYSPTALSPWEVARQTRKATRNMIRTIG